MGQTTRRKLLATGVCISLGGCVSSARSDKKPPHSGGNDDEKPETAVIDDFEGGDIGEYSGDIGSFSVAQNGAQDGSYFLRSTDHNSNIYSNIGDGLENYPQRGDEFSFYAWLGDRTSDGVGMLIFFDGSLNEGYEIRIGRESDADLELIRRNGSNRASYLYRDTDATLLNQAWMRCEVVTDQSGYIEATLYDDNETQLGQISGADDTYDHEGVGWTTSGSGPSASHMDEVRVDHAVLGTE